jgi:hypothetical protein
VIASASDAGVRLLLQARRAVSCANGPMNWAGQRTLKPPEACRAP